jgi:hypothetical protein
MTLFHFRYSPLAYPRCFSPLCFALDNTFHINPIGIFLRYDAIIIVLTKPDKFNTHIHPILLRDHAVIWGNTFSEARIIRSTCGIHRINRAGRSSVVGAVPGFENFE